MHLLVTGDLHDESGQRSGVELWRVPFRGWSEAHRLKADALCAPRRYALIEGGVERAAGYCGAPTVLPAGVFTLQIGRPQPG